MKDAFYTPRPLAKEMIEAARVRTVVAPTTIADFAAGGGELLREAGLVWTKARILAADIDEKAIRKLRRWQPKWTVARCDFTDFRSRSSFFARYGLAFGVDLVLLNPPFSCRGGRAHEVRIAGRELRCSLALSFLIESLPSLSAHGQAIAILPAGSLTSEKDAEAWALLRDLGQVETLRSNHQRTFPDTTLRTVVVRFSKKGSQLAPSSGRRFAIVRAASPQVELVRGTVQMHTVKKHRRGWPLIHTTELRDGMVNLGARLVDRGRRVDPPCVFVPRVGQPSVQKIVLHTDGLEAGLSDCVIALKAGRRDEAQAVHSMLLRDWDAFAECYVGSCAPYLTVNRLREFLTSRGVSVEVRSRNSQHEEETLAV